MTDNFCIAPFIHLNNTPRGQIDPCCVWNGDKVGNMERGILDAWNSNEMVNLRNQFLNNERPVACIRCWAVEDSGSSHSFRIRANTDFKKYLEHKQINKTKRCSDGSLDINLEHLALDQYNSKQQPPPPPV